jgi:hypothetical protein
VVAGGHGSPGLQPHKQGFAVQVNDRIDEAALGRMSAGRPAIVASLNRATRIMTP